MRIDDIRPDTSRADKARTAAPVSGPARPGRTTAERRDATDQVAISAEGRALAAQDQSAAAPPEATLAPDQLAELRRWVHTGGFNDPAVVEQVAKRLLSSGEV